ncbi:conserved hypothetical protein, homologous to putative transposase, IS110 family (plasmid) [Escherichia fergusonii ATCC 35469]|uniref:Transposase IS116/IS110/IS902 C-terminal domain-containing protein n=1 Tax=Escherichia fergusonii (strain ATCC 35469 / DSM 13698 / CCUG 18766 / IAM 14443 / JCM 21226 / LMG 7866 / NBRC 102419 / NCTC 12128 / CDC 0568-73) TaxID=585054 RepID=B7L3T3_ESCF3|nr:ISEc21 transposase [Escherichia coli]CAQ86940.1 conserved hypothetical protein, homologous to putative transposase, IS110 family [Escherichia fergusonii ATCC 35469]
MTRMQLIRTLGSWRPDASEYRNVTNVYRISLKSLARRYLELHDEIADLDVMIAAIVDELAPELIKRNAIGYESASQLLITAGDNPQRLRSESGFAALCGVSPVPVSSGKTNRYRLNRGGDRAANSALHIIAIGRLRTDAKTKEYVARRVMQWQNRSSVHSKKSASGSGYTKPGTWPGRIFSIILKCSTTGPGATVISAASARRPSKRPRSEDRNCLPERGHSTFKETSFGKHTCNDSIKWRVKRHLIN